ncbi:hypothetical protein KI688_011257 [Linnemannia hyalina]|uniref:Maintenance of telomere capping protein 6 n=1 Tax=Linnemannia hyalina TaxID=64524 RepID=A0A9P7XUS2_9FUNG|nr:hypothetical protein KI688_011257 [Linnemannia hyalina]
MIQPCDAIPRDSDKNQRVDAPSPDDYPPLEGPNFAFTSQTPLGNLSEPREYADGAQATQKLIADPIVPINRQLWTGIDTRTAYFKNDFGQDKISRVPELLQAGMRRLVLDLWWDSAALGWQLCPRLKRDTTGSPLTTLRLALEQEQERFRAMSGSAGGVGGGATDDSLSQLQGMGNSVPAVEATAEEFDQASRLGQEQEQEQGRQGNEPIASDATGSSVKGVSRYAASHHPHRVAPNRLAMSKGVVASYNPLAAGAADQTMDGITCSTGEDIVLLLQALEAWIERSRSPELEDIILIILNLNELNNNSLGTRPNTPPTTPPTPTSATPAPPGATPTTTPPISNAEFFEHINSPNTNRTINELAATKMVSLRQLFIDAFPQSIYTPNLLELDRADVEATWWKGGPVGLDYYNTTRNPTTNKLEAPTGWPTSLYLRKEANRRIVIGIGSNNLAANTTYNITDDYQTFHQQAAMGPSMTNSSLLRVLPTLNQDTCSLPVPGVSMSPTGSEESFAEITALRRRGETITDDVTWSFASMSDNDMSPWTFLSGRVVTNCGFSSLVEGRSQSLTYSEQTAMTIWSWDLDQPPDEIMRDQSRRCGAMKRNGRWVVQDCNDKLPVACRKVGTSYQWIINEKGAGNYRDVTCPEGYKFDVPRTARENQMLYSTIQAFRNTTAYSSLPSSQPLTLGQLEKSASSLKPAFNRFTDAVSDVFKNLKKREERTGKLQPPHDKSKSHDDDEDDARSNNGRKAQSVSDEHQQQQQHSGGSTATRIKEVKAEPTAMAGANDQSGGGVIWIDISSWQTAGCWVPGGSDGICPYQEPDNTVALQDIIKVSTIGGVIILVLVGIFLYMKFRRNGRLRKAGRRRADVRRKILLTEVETVPA